MKTFLLMRPPRMQGRWWSQGKAKHARKGPKCSGSWCRSRGCWGKALGALGKGDYGRRWLI